jgi:hypothetical protein
LKEEGEVTAQFHRSGVRGFEPHKDIGETKDLQRRTVMKKTALIFVAIASGLLLLTAGIAPSDGFAKWEQRFPDIVVYTAAEPLSPDARLSDGRYTPIPLTTHTLVTWIDPMPDADFAHPTFYVLIGADGEVRVLDGWWWPYVDGETYLYTWAPWEVCFPVIVGDAVSEGVMIYAYPHVLTPSDQLLDGDTRIPVTGTTLLVWVDLYPSLFFAHPTAYILITATGEPPIQGEVLVHEGEWWPTLNGEAILLDEGSTRLRFPFERLRALPACPQ